MWKIRIMMTMVMKSILTSCISTFFPYSWFYLKATFIINTTLSILLSIKPSTFILISGHEFKPALTMFPTISILSYIILPVFPKKCTSSIINSIFPLPLIIIFNIKGSEFNFSFAMRNKLIPIYLPFINSTILVDNFS